MFDLEINKENNCIEFRTKDEYNNFIASLNKKECLEFLKEFLNLYLELL